MAFNAIMVKKRRAVLLQYDEICDEEGWQVIIKVWKVPVSRTSPEGMDYSLSLISLTESEWWGMTITGLKAITATCWERKVHILIRT